MTRDALLSWLKQEGGYRLQTSPAGKVAAELAKPLV
jgi:hypothetical protein